MGMPRNAGRHYVNRPQPFDVVAKITAAADVQASGFVVTEGKDYVSAVTRTAEGKVKIALRQSFPKCNGFSLTTTRADSYCYLENDTSSSGSDPHLDVVFRSATPADVDPDSAVMTFIFHFQLTSNADTDL